MSITTAAEDILKYFFIFFSEKIRHDTSCESSARQRIHMNSMPFFLQNVDKEKKSVSSAAILLAASRVAFLPLFPIKTDSGRKYLTTLGVNK